jgi:hypothetical protein
MESPALNLYLEYIVCTWLEQFLRSEAAILRWWCISPKVVIQARLLPGTRTSLHLLASNSCCNLSTSTTALCSTFSVGIWHSKMPYSNLYPLETEYWKLDERPISLPLKEIRKYLRPAGCHVNGDSDLEDLRHIVAIKVRKPFVSTLKKNSEISTGLLDPALGTISNSMAGHPLHRIRRLYSDRTAQVRQRPWTYYTKRREAIKINSHSEIVGSR